MREAEGVGAAVMERARTRANALLWPAASALTLSMDGVRSLASVEAKMVAQRNRAAAGRGGDGREYSSRSGSMMGYERLQPRRRRPSPVRAGGPAAARRGVQPGALADAQWQRRRGRGAGRVRASAQVLW